MGTISDDKVKVKLLFVIQEKRRRPRGSALFMVHHQLSPPSPPPVLSVPLTALGNTATPATREVVSRSKVKELAEPTGLTEGGQQKQG